MNSSTPHASRSTVYTVGYLNRLTPELLQALADRLDARIIDIRAKPQSRLKAWSKDHLETALRRYEWRGDILGGWPPRARNHSTTDEGLRALASLGGNSIVFCACAATGDCHRHSLVGLPSELAGVHVRHLWSNDFASDEIEVFAPSELERARAFVSPTCDGGCDDEACPCTYKVESTFMLRA